MISLHFFLSSVDRFFYCCWFTCDQFILIFPYVFYSDYMDKELQPVYEHSDIRQQLDALVYQKRCGGVLLMFLALGTIQVISILNKNLFGL